MDIEIRESISGYDKIDKERRLLKGITILGRVSSNKYVKGTVGTIFSDAAMADVATLAENSKVYLDHQSESADRDNRGVRSIRDLAGHIENTHISDNKVKADMRYLRNHAALLEDLVDTMSDKIGFSMHAWGPMSIDRSRNMGITESIKKLDSIDIVTTPASTGGLYESRQNERQNDEITEGLDRYSAALLNDTSLEGREWDAERNRLIEIGKASREKKQSSQSDYLDAVNLNDDF